MFTETGSHVEGFGVAIFAIVSIVVVIHVMCDGGCVGCCCCWEDDDDAAEDGDAANDGLWRFHRVLEIIMVCYDNILNYGCCGILGICSHYL